MHNSQEEFFTAEDVISKNPEITPDIRRLPQTDKNLFVPFVYRSVRQNKKSIGQD